jgi:UDP-N-acetylglucosamine 4-epimerase
LNDLVISLKNNLGEYDPKIKEVQVIYGPNRIGDIPHSMASIEKAQKLLDYQPQVSLQNGLKQAVKWYWDNLK